MKNKELFLSGGIQYWNAFTNKYRKTTLQGQATHTLVKSAIPFVLEAIL